MTDKELYKATFAHLRASGSGTRQEERRMKHGHIRKGAVVAAAAAALTVTAAGAANVATDGALLENIRVMFTGEVTDTPVKPGRLDHLLDQGRRRQRYRGNAAAGG